MKHRVLSDKLHKSNTEEAWQSQTPVINYTQTKKTHWLEKHTITGIAEIINNHS